MSFSIPLRSETIELVARLTSLYIQLAKDVASFEAIEPSFSMEEATAGWIISSAMKVEAFGQDLDDGSASHFYSFFSEFLAISFGHVLENLEAVRIGDVPTLSNLKQAAQTTIENLPSKRASVLVKISGAMALTAAKLARGTVEIALECLTDGEKLRARNTAFSLLASHSMLDPSVKENAEAWIIAAAWTKSTFDSEAN